MDLPVPSPALVEDVVASWLRPRPSRVASASFAGASALSTATVWEALGLRTMIAAAVLTAIIVTSNYKAFNDFFVRDTSPLDPTAGWLDPL